MVTCVAFLPYAWICSRKHAESNSAGDNGEAGGPASHSSKKHSHQALPSERQFR